MPFLTGIDEVTGNRVFFEATLSQIYFGEVVDVVDDSAEGEVVLYSLELTKCNDIDTEDKYRFTKGAR